MADDLITVCALSMFLSLISEKIKEPDSQIQILSRTCYSLYKDYMKKQEVKKQEIINN